MRMQRAHGGHYLVMLCALGLMMLMALTFGSSEIALATISRVLLSLPEIASDSTSVIIVDIRLPRILLAFLVGALLGISGAAVQGMFRNPLAEPGILGISSGATLSVMFAIVLAPGLVQFLNSYIGLFTLPLFAFFGALSAAFVILYFQGKPRFDATSIILLGIGINLLAATGIGLCSYLASDQQLRTLTYWRLGSLGGANWAKVLCCLAGFFICAPLIAMKHKALNALLLGESEARHLGFRIEQDKQWIIFLCAVSVAFAVSFCGLIGFIGLVVPHMLRLVFGPNHKHLVPLSALLGSLVLVLADTIARTILAPAEMPVGIITAAIGTPVFLGLLLSQRRMVS